MRKREDTLKKKAVVITRRELEVIRLIVKEYNNKKIAEELFLSIRTVETHRKNIYRKTGTHNVIALLKYAGKNGLVKY